MYDSSGGPPPQSAVAKFDNQELTMRNAPSSLPPPHLLHLGWPCRGGALGVPVVRSPSAISAESAVASRRARPLTHNCAINIESYTTRRRGTPHRKSIARHPKSGLCQQECPCPLFVVVLHPSPVLNAVT